MLYKSWYLLYRTHFSKKKDRADLLGKWNKKPQELAVSVSDTTALPFNNSQIPKVETTPSVPKSQQIQKLKCPESWKSGRLTREGAGLLVHFFNSVSPLLAFWERSFTLSSSLTMSFAALSVTSEIPRATIYLPVDSLGEDLELVWGTNPHLPHQSHDHLLTACWVKSLGED